MGVITRLYQRFSQLFHEVAKFGTVGALAYATQVGATNLFWYGLGAQELLGQALGTLCATFVAFVGNRFWTFGHRARTGLAREYALFFVLNAVGLGIQVGCLGVAVYLLGLDGPLARNIAGNVVGVALGSLFRFWSYKRWVFPAEPPATGRHTPQSTS
ncbi:GtrA family protein [Lipingzhangella sp. LS1_29]|uniref:GtrA family protein n=1 Tax=Lipingzhangella rawalii TaxID=2055835 RepID=A0ABU2H522_9ACTN|nr:GtrA family protein [Lipingzhangella rawalii]MDS1270402.1 GtrA family protein [Lipingzhangella rawalii]